MLGVDGEWGLFFLSAFEFDLLHLDRGSTRIEQATCVSGYQEAKFAGLKVGVWSHVVVALMNHTLSLTRKDTPS